MPVAGDDRRPLYNHLREIRQRRNVSRAELAEALEVNVQTIGALERGRYSPSLYLALVLAEALDVRLNEIFGLQGDGDDSDDGADGAVRHDAV